MKWGNRRKGKASKPYLPFLVEVVLSELKSFATTLQRHRKAAAAAVGAGTAIFLTGIPEVLRMAFQHLGPMGTAAVVALGAFMAINNASIVLSGPKRASQ